MANKHDTRYTIGYEVEPGKIVSLCIKTPKNCLSSGVTRYSKSSQLKMGFNVGGDEAWMRRYEAVWKKVEELLGERLMGEPLSSGKYVNPKLITWDSRIRTAFRGTSPEPRDWGLEDWERVPAGIRLPLAGVFERVQVPRDGCDF